MTTAAAVASTGPQQDHGVERQAEDEGEGVADGEEDVFVRLVNTTVGGEERWGWDGTRRVDGVGR